MIIAEAGLWHKGSASKARVLVDAAKECGADAVKFQIFIPDRKLFCPVKGDEKRRQFWNETSLSLEEWIAVANRANDIGLKFGASVFQTTAVPLLNTLEPDFVKVASRAAACFPYDDFDGPFYISTGMVDSSQRQKIAHHLMSQGKKYRFLHCVSEYPVVLKRARWPGNGDGLSDHSGNPMVGIEALARGCNLLEVHFCTEKTPGEPDYHVSLLPRDLSLICEARDAFAEMRESS